MSIEIRWACFEAEALWQDPTLVTLPSFVAAQADSQLSCLDEVQVARTAAEQVFTVIAPDQALVGYHASLGLASSRTSAFDNPEDWLAAGMPHWAEAAAVLCHGLPHQGRQRPFACVPAAYQCTASSAHLPSFDAVVKVNDKRYAVEVCRQLNIPQLGEIVSTRSSLLALNAHALPMILKEPFGVSGKGSLVVRHPAIWERVREHLLCQVAAGRQVGLIAEPFVEKEVDFSSQWQITRGGDITLLGLSEITNDNLKFSGVKAMGDGLFQRIRAHGYPELLRPLLARLYQDGYWGPVCVDSMLLTSGEIVPVVEINARESMGGIAQDWFARLAVGGEVRFQQVSVKYSQPLDIRQLLDELARRGCLVTGEHQYGYVPLNSRCVQLPGETPRIGRLYLLQVEPEDDAQQAQLAAALADQGARLL
ncbi:hypothetical protein [Photobacterium atrarenae]|uniref:ATP-grasp domain-containing protein n=1 Tax=Photobacterium atrarenae TaxID=865757 RepID=A0ABY5GCV3_9GAMM|nr:hypothetical protein [Photobacterium atrarenae]UTV26939.1 hypothetical protein NNL38_11340 [Photobacterium atrarenae]